jgi:tetratricopeptide (TPR) repeat protein
MSTCPSCSAAVPDDAPSCPACDATVAMPAVEASDRRLAGHKLLRLIGQGGMGRVWLAEDESLGRRVAIKVIVGEMQRSDAMRARFVREARAMATVEHANVVRIYSFGEADGNSYIVMEYVEGEMLADKLLRGPLPPDEALRITRQVVDALDAAWEKQIVHRDIKPSNVLLDRRGNARVADFGLAKATHIESDASLTQAGYMLGSPHYVAPEQARGESADFRADIYSLGIMLYEMLVGEKPFKGTSPFAVVAQHLNDPMPPLDDRVPPPVARLVAWMTQKEPSRRPSSYAELRAAVDNIEGPTEKLPARMPLGSRRISWQVIAMLIVGLILAGVSVFVPRLVPRGTPHASSDYAPTSFAVAVAPFYGPDAESAKEGRLMASLIETAVQERLGSSIRVIGVDETKEAVRSGDAARAMAERIHASVVIWGDALTLRGETEIKPSFTMNLPTPPKPTDTSLSDDAVLDLRDQRGGELVTTAATPNQIEARRTNAAGIADVITNFAGLFVLRSERNAEKALHILELGPRTPESLRNRAQALIALDRRPEALAAVEEAAKLAPGDADTQTMRGDMAVDDGRWSDAVQAYAAAIATGKPLRAARGMLYDGRLYILESFTSISNTRGLRQDTISLLARDPVTGVVLERRYLPGIPRVFTPKGESLEITYDIGDRDLALEKIVLTHGRFDRPIFLPVTLLWRMRTAKHGWALAANFLDRVYGPLFNADAKFEPSKKPVPDAPNTFPELDAALRRAIADDPTMPESLMLLGMSQWTQGKRADADATWRELFNRDYPGTPWYEYSWMARTFEQLRLQQWADRAYEQALRRRDEIPQPRLAAQLIEQLISAPFGRMAARINAVTPYADQSRPYSWLIRLRKLSGSTVEGDDFASLAWARYFRAHGNRALADRELAYAQRVRHSPLNVAQVSARVDYAFYAVITSTATLWIALAAFLWRAGGAVRARPRRSRLDLAVTIVIVATAALVAAQFLRDTTGRTTLAVAAFLLFAAGVAVTWRYGSLVAVVEEMTLQERLTVSVGAAVMIVSYGCLVAAAHGFFSASRVPPGIMDSIGHPAFVQKIEQHLREYDTPRGRYAGAVLNHMAGNRKRAAELYRSVQDEPRVSANLDALESGSLVPPRQLEVADLVAAFAPRRTWLLVFPAVGTVPWSVDVPQWVALSIMIATLVAGILALLVAYFSFNRAARRTAAPARKSALIRGLSYLIPGLADLTGGAAARGAATLAAFVLTVAVIVLRAESPRAPAPGYLTVHQSFVPTQSLPFPNTQSIPIDEVGKKHFVTILFGYEWAMLFWTVVAVATTAWLAVHGTMIVRAVREREVNAEATIATGAATP